MQLFVLVAVGCLFAATLSEGRSVLEDAETYVNTVEDFSDILEDYNVKLVDRRDRVRPPPRIG